MKTVKMMMCLTLVLSMTMVGVAAADSHKKSPDATIVIDNWQVAAIAEVQLGEGKLNFQGKEHDIKFSGVGFGSVGIQKVELTGDVYNLKKLEDISGKYAEARADITVGLGVGAVAVENDKGVVIKLIAKSKGLALSVAAEGVTIELK